METLHDRYLHALISDLKNRYPQKKGKPLTTLFIGGGTPTILSPKKLVMILKTCRETFGFADQAEVTIEVNPDSVDPETLETLAFSGVNRLSIGAQSFFLSELKTLGRRYDPGAIPILVQEAKKAGIGRISLDLIYGLPGQQIRDWRQSLEKALELGVEHLSLYQLTIEEKTPYHEWVNSGRLHLPDDDLVLDMERCSEEICGQHGMNRYEISNYCLPGKECRHNLVYWHNEAYMGCGAGAVGYIDKIRFRIVDDPVGYCDAIEKGSETVAEREKLGRYDSFRETVMIGLRLVKGVEEGRLLARFGLSLAEVYGETLSDLMAQELLVYEAGRLFLTRRGLRFANQVMARLV